MARMTAQVLRDILNWMPDYRPKLCVETGTGQGNTTAIFGEHFSEVYTIELSEEYHRQAVERFKHRPNINCYRGHSYERLADLDFNEPIFYYLDAHWTPFFPEAAGQGDFPLFRELGYIINRPYADIVVVDDLHCFGDKEPESDWLIVNGPDILSFLDSTRVKACAEFNDQFIVWRKPS